MKRTAAILFITVILFNLVGYRVVLSSLQQSTEAVIETKVDAADYNEADLISIKTVLHLPYYASSAEFERVYGSLNINGKDYEYVKRRVYNDTLEVLCLPNGDKTKLKSVEHDLIKASADGQASTEKKGTATIKLSLPDFFQEFYLSGALDRYSVSQVHLLANASLLRDGFRRNTERPPASMRILS